MNDEYDWTADLGTLGEIADDIFSALTKVERLRADLLDREARLSEGFAAQSWDQLPTTLRLAVLQVIYATYSTYAEPTDEVVQLRKDLYAEMDAHALHVGRLRKIK